VDSENRGVHVHHARERNKITKLLFDYIYLIRIIMVLTARKITARTREKGPLFGEILLIM